MILSKQFIDIDKLCMETRLMKKSFKFQISIFDEQIESGWAIVVHVQVEANIRD